MILVEHAERQTCYFMASAISARSWFEELDEVLRVSRVYVMNPCYENEQVRGEGAITSTMETMLESIRSLCRRQSDLDASTALTAPVGTSQSGTSGARMNQSGEPVKDESLALGLYSALAVVHGPSSEHRSQQEE